MACLERKCTQCGKPSRYCCPKCSARSCSLPCVKQHKRNEECDGIRDKTAYIPLSDFSDLDLLSDYRFLEESSRVAENAYRNKSKLGIFSQRSCLPGNVHQLQVRAGQKGVHLKILPKCFTKRRENTSQYHFKEKCIYWHILWDFVQAETKVHDERIPEKETLGRCLGRNLNPDTCEPELLSKLQFYQAAGLRDICVLMAIEGKPAQDASYHQLDLSATIEDNLKGKTIIEYPTFLVVSKEHSAGFRIISEETGQQQEGSSMPSFFSNPNVSSGSSEEE